MNAPAPGTVLICLAYGGTPVAFLRVTPTGKWSVRLLDNQGRMSLAAWDWMEVRPEHVRSQECFRLPAAEDVERWPWISYRNKEGGAS